CFPKKRNLEAFSRSCVTGIKMRRMGWVKASAAAFIATLMSSTAHAALTTGQAGVAMAVLPGGSAPPQITPLDAGASGQVLTAPAGYVLDLLFTDGTSVRLSPGGSIRIEDYSFNRAAGTGTLHLTISQGVARIIGGALGQ